MHWPRPRTPSLPDFWQCVNTDSVHMVVFPHWNCFIIPFLDPSSGREVETCFLTKAGSQSVLCPFFFPLSVYGWQIVPHQPVSLHKEVWMLSPASPVPIHPKRNEKNVSSSSEMNSCLTRPTPPSANIH